MYTQEYTATSSIIMNNSTICLNTGSRKHQHRRTHTSTRRIDNSTGIIDNNMMIKCQSQSRRINLHSTLISIVCIFGIIVVLIVGTVQVPLLVYGKEIVVTNEWQRIGTNDTIPQGVHVRMDLSTGDKFVKLIDDNDSNADSNAEEVSSTSMIMINDNKDNTKNNNNNTRTIINATNILRNYTSSASDNYNDNKTKQSIKPKSTIIHVRKDLRTDISNTTTEADTVVNQKKPKQQTNYDFDMMYRTLDQLPIEEKIYMGLPESLVPPVVSTPLSNVSTIDESINDSIRQQKRIEFETKMIQIWEYRQEQLLLFQDTMIADSIKILKERINSIQSYINNPSYYIKYFLTDSKTNNTNDNDDNEHSTTTNDDNNNDNNDNDYSVQSNNIISILADLEYQLTDVDMTRDFYTMDGWPLLVSLLHNDVHYYNINNDTSAATATATTNGDDGNDTVQIQIIIDQIQTYVAWILGTAVKNTGEFTPYVLDNIILHNEQTRIYTNSTPLSLVIDLIQSTNTRIIQETSNTGTNNAAATVFILQKKLDKLLYCLGSFLRGNSQAQEQFVTLLLSSSLDTNENNNSNNNNNKSVIGNNGSVLLRTICQELGLVPVVGSTVRTTNNNNNSSNRLLLSINYRMQLLQRIIQLITDIIMEVTSTRTKYDHHPINSQHTSYNNNNSNTSLLVQSFTDTDWCTTYIDFLNPSNFYNIEKDDTTTILQDYNSNNTTSKQHDKIHEFKKIIQYSEIMLDNIVNIILSKNYCIDTFTISIDTITSHIRQWITIWDTATTKQQQFRNEQQDDNNDNRITILDQERYHILLQLSDTLMKQFVVSATTLTTTTTTTEKVSEQDGTMKDVTKSEEL